jgi:hypothetical protein
MGQRCASARRRESLNVYVMWLRSPCVPFCKDPTVLNPRHHPWAEDNIDAPQRFRKGKILTVSANLCVVRIRSCCPLKGYMCTYSLLAVR